MHKFEMPPDYIKRVTARQGRPHICETFIMPRTALLVVDMQNYFYDRTLSGRLACPVAQKIVLNVNRLAKAIRKIGGKVIWIQNLAPWKLEKSWSAIKEMYTPDKAKARWESSCSTTLTASNCGRSRLHVEDERVIKRRYSAFIQGSSNIENVLRDNGIETIIVTGVATNACCVLTARDAMMLNYRSLMVSDGCAAATDEEHAATLGNFYLFFGDVQSTNQIAERLKCMLE